MYRNQQPNLVVSSGPFIVKIAERYKELEKAFRLRFEVFNKELNEGLVTSHVTGMDRDIYDDFCDHLIVIDTRCNKVIGTYRLMLGFVAENNKGYYSEGEFDLTSIKKLKGEKLELGRSCVHKDYRSANIISLLWAGIARYAEMYEVRHLFGCASLHTTDPEEVGMIYSYMNSYHWADHPYTVYPRRRLYGMPMTSIIDKRTVFEKLPSLVKGYLRLGALLCGEPAYDPHFGTADLFLMLETERLISRYRRRFFQEPSVAVCTSAYVEESCCSL